MTQNQPLKRRMLVLAFFSLGFVVANALEAQKSSQHSRAVIEKRVAVIGAGAGGSSAAFWLSKAFPSTGDISVSTTIFEAADYVGGRSTVIPIKDDPELGVVELGASVFVNVNWNMMNATKKFGLELKDLESIKSRVGIWDGQKFIFQETGNSWWDNAKAIIKYGVAPFRVRNLVLSAVDRLSYAYSHDISPSFTSIKNFTNFLNFGEETGRTARRYFITDSRIEAKYIEQIVQSATRVNYGQDIDTIHALGALVSMAANGVKSVKGGNFQIFQKFIEEAGAELRLKTKVVGIKKVVDNKTGGKLYEVESKGGKKELFDAVILAAPIHQTNINFNDIPSSAAADLLANPPAFQTIHVTFIAGKRDPTYFGIDDLSKAPNMVITTADTSLFPEHRQPFTTFAEHHLHNETGESIVKMFSAAEVPDSLLDALFVSRSWTRRHVWEAYPVLTPVSDIEHERMAEEDRKRFSGENKLSMSNIRDKLTEFLRSWGILPQKQAEVVKPVEKEVYSLESNWPPVVLDEKHEGEGDGGVFYVNGFESFISTMETETVASKNIVRLLHKQWCEGCEPFGDGWTAEDAAESVPKDATKSKDEL